MRPKDEKTGIAIISTTGQVVRTQTVESGKTVLAIHDLANCIYFIKATASGSQQMIKMIKEYSDL